REHRDHGGLIGDEGAVEPLGAGFALTMEIIEHGGADGRFVGGFGAGRRGGRESEEENGDEAQHDGAPDHEGSASVIGVHRDTRRAKRSSTDSPSRLVSVTGRFLSSRMLRPTTLITPRGPRSLFMCVAT